MILLLEAILSIPMESQGLLNVVHSSFGCKGVVKSTLKLWTGEIAWWPNICLKCSMKHRDSFKKVTICNLYIHIINKIYHCLTDIDKCNRYIYLHAPMKLLATPEVSIWRDLGSIKMISCLLLVFLGSPMWPNFKHHRMYLFSGFTWLLGITLALMGK